MQINFSRRPSKKVLDPYQVNVPSDPPFRAWCRLKQSIYRKDHGWACGVGGRAKQSLGNYLTPEDTAAGRNFLNDTVFKAAKRRLAHRERNDAIEPHRLQGNMLTSQTLCFNLFLPQQDPAMATAIWRMVLSDQVATVQEVLVEHSPGRCCDEAGIGDKSAFDAFVRYTHCDGRTGILAIETKYTDSFSPPPSKACDENRLRRFIGSDGLMTEEGWEKAKAMRTQQLWRTHFLAESMRGSDIQHVTYLVLYAKDDKECLAKLPKHEEALSERALNERRFLHMTLEDFCQKACTAALPNNAAHWLNAFHKRYLDWSEVEILSE